jgi:hypothetical protein
MRVGTWNLQQAVPGWSKATAQAELMNSIDADIWCLTEAHGAVVLAGHQITHSTPRPSKPQQRWSAISTRWPITPIQADHEGLALGRVTSPHGPLVVATSVMPWRGAAGSWPGDPTDSLMVRFTLALRLHLHAIQQARVGIEPVVWGGDFNQALTGRETAGSLAGRRLLLEAFEALGLKAVTADADHRIAGIYAIDHVAVPTAWGPPHCRKAWPMSSTGKPLSDHALYVVDV